MALQSWWQVTTPDSDIVKGELDESVFAADLWSVVAGKAPQEYKDTALFFRKTYLTQGLSNLLEGVLGRLSEGKGSGVIQLQTPFGGGKTHALLALYHAVQNRKEASHITYLKPLVDALPTEAKVACFVGTYADPLKGKTPWGAIAQQLGCYELVKEHDKKRVAPGKEVLTGIFERSGPTLVLIDELLEYVVKAARAEEVNKTEKGQTLAFLQELSEVATSIPQLALVLTLPASTLEQYDEEAEKALEQIQKISGRVEAIHTPVEGMEIYEVIRTRLFEELGEEMVRKDVAAAYFELYQKMGNAAPAEVKGIAYRDKIEHAYPFHPELIDALYERWGSFPKFQRTRGALRLLGLVVQDLYKKKEPSPLIHSSLLDLTSSKLRREFVKHIGNEYDSVIASDIAGGDAKAVKIEADMGSEYEKYRIAQGIATSVFLNSFSGGERKGITLPWLRVSLVRETIPASLVGDTVKKLENELWYFHAEGDLFRFTNQPNLNRVILDKEETIGDEYIIGTLREELQKIAGSNFEVIVWPRNSSDVSDGRKVKLVLLSPDYLCPGEEADSLAKELFSRAGSSFRAYRNALIVLAMEASQWLTLKAFLRRHLALESLYKSSDMKEKLASADLAELESKHKETNKSLPDQIISVYRWLAMSSSEGFAWRNMGMVTVGSGTKISFRVKEYLQEQELLLSKVGSRFILDKAFAKDEGEKPLQEIGELFLKTPGMPLLDGADTLTSSIRDAVKNGSLGLRIGEDIYLKEEPSYIPDDALVLRPGKAKELKEAEEGATPTPGGEAPTPPGTPAGGPVEPPTAETGLPKKVLIKGKIPWDKLSDLIGGVIMPLKSKGADIEIVVEISADSDEGFDRTTLDTKVKETLNQIGADFEWEEK